MDDWKLGMVESRFAQLIWDNAPIRSGDLVKLCGKELGWKKSTTYTVLKKLSEKGLFQTQDSIVTVLISKQEFEGLQSQQFVDEAFAGSLPAFLTAFGSRKKLSDSEIEELQRVIESMRG